MKQIFRNNRLIAIALMTVFSLAAAPVLANGGGKETAAQLNYVGTINNHQMFQLNVAGDELNNEFTILIKDEFGNQVYKEYIKSENFSKRFLFDTDELGSSSLHFEVVSRKTKKSVVYEISSSVSLVKNISVSEVK
jgi:hypothetical protein